MNSVTESIDMRTPWARVLTVLVCLLALTSPLAAQTPPETVEFYGRDAVGSVRVVFDIAGTVIGRADYLPFGEDQTTTTNLPPERFTGQVRDPEVGIDYFLGRGYQPRTARFAQVDSAIDGALANPQRWNRYAYALNSPLVNVDPTGLVPICRVNSRDEMTCEEDPFPQAPGSSTPSPSDHTPPTKCNQLTDEQYPCRGNLPKTPGETTGNNGGDTTSTTPKCPGDPTCILIAPNPGGPPIWTTQTEWNAALQAQKVGLATMLASYVTVYAAEWTVTRLLLPWLIPGKMTVDSIMQNPQSLSGLKPAEVATKLGNVPQSWRIETLRQGSREGAGWVLREYTLRGNETGRMLRWHPGGGHHGALPYWNVNTANEKIGPIF
jgi:RHS repeat-associated protein